MFNDLGMCQSDYSRSPPKSSKGGDIGTNVFEGFLTKLTFALNTGMCYNQTKDLVVMNSVCSYLFYPPTSPKGGSNQNALYVTAQRLPQLDYNTSELILNGWTVTAIRCITPSDQWRRINLPESQQRPYLSLEPSAHPWADLELPH